MFREFSSIWEIQAHIRWWCFWIKNRMQPPLLSGIDEPHQTSSGSNATFVKSLYLADPPFKSWAKGGAPCQIWNLSFVRAIV